MSPTQNRSDDSQPNVPSLSDEESDQLGEILSLLHAHTGSNFTHYKRSSLLRRIGRRMQVCELDDLSSYARFLKEHPEEINQLYDELLISVTRFFRNAEAFDALGDIVIPELFEDKTSDDELRIWVPACATGEEAYSLGMLVAEEDDRRSRTPEIRLFATDIDTRAVATARLGCYSEASVADISDERRDRFFEWVDDAYRAHDRLRQMMFFAEHNLLHDPPFSQLDLISCRNLLIYLNPQAQKQLFHLFHYALNPHGVLFLGHSESTGQASDLFEAVDSEKRIFRPRAVSPTSVRLPARMSISGRRQTVPRFQTRSEKSTPAVSRLHQQLLVERYAPPSVIVDENYHMLHISGATDHFLKRAEGVPSNNLVENVPDGLRLELRGALFKAVQRGDSTRRKCINFEMAGDPVTLYLTVEPVQDDDNRFLVMFEQAADEDVPAAGEADQPSRPSEKVRRLEEELRQTKRELQALIEEYETSNEELQSANEELYLMNEELQASEDQLQSANEELEKRVAERTAELRASEEKFRRLFRDAQHGVAVSTPDGRLVDANPAALDILGYSKEEIKQLNLASLYVDPDQRAEGARRLQEQGVIHDYEVHLRRKDGREIICRLSASVRRNNDGDVDAFQVIFRDVTEQKRMEHELRRYEDRVKNTMAKLPVYVFNQDRDLRYTWLSGSLPDLNTDELLGKRDDELFPDAQMERLNEAKREVIRTGETARLDTTLTIEDETRYYDTYLTPQRNENGDITGVVGATMDVTERRRAEKQRRRSEKKYRDLFEVSRDAIAIASADNKILDLNPSGEEMLGYSAEELNQIGTAALYVDPERRDEIGQQMAETGSLRNEEVRVERKGGEEIVCLLTATMRTNEQGEPEAYYIIFRDITDRKRAQEALEDSERRFRMLAERSLVGIYLYRNDGYEYVNPRFTEIFGYDADEISSFEDLVHPDDWPRAKENVRKRMTGEESAIRYHFRGLTREGQIRYLEGYGARINYKGDPAIVGTVLDVTERRRMQQEILRIQEEEQRRIGQELHDGVASQLTGLRMLSQGLTHDLREGKSVSADELKEISDLIKESAEEIRLLSRGLNPTDMKGKHITQALQKLAENTAERTNIPCRFEVEEEDPDLTGEQATHLYRISQEAVNNAVKHAEADQIEIRLHADREKIMLRVTDDGVGLPEDAEAAEGMGLRSMRYRADLLGAQLEIANRPEGGAQVRCHLSHQS